MTAHRRRRRAAATVLAVASVAAVGLGVAIVLVLVARDVPVAEPPAGRPAVERALDAGPTTPTTTPSADVPTPVPPETTAAVRRRPPAAHVFPVAGCAVSYVGAHHDYPAADIFAGRGCAFVAPTDGRVDEVSTEDDWDAGSNVGADRGGLFVSVVGRDGVRYYGSHLEALVDGIRPGVRVRAGEPLGRIGDTGSARGTGTHLHFGLSWPTEDGFWWIRRGVLSPAPFLDAWREGEEVSPASAVARLRADYGDDSACRAYC